MVEEDAGRLGDKIGHRVEHLTKATGTGMRRRRHRASLAITAIVAGAVAIIWFNPMDIRPPQAGAARTEAAVPVVAGQVEQINVPVYLTGIGTVQAFNSVVVKARVDGQIVKVDFTEGQDIHAGDVLAEIDPAPFAAALAQAEATRLKDMAQLDNARRDLARASRLAASGNATAQQFDTARSLVAQNEASLKADEAAVDAAQIQLNYTKIRSPIDGRAGMRTLDLGNIVHANDAGGIVTINQIHPISVMFALPAATLPELREAMKKADVSVVAESNDGRRLATGKLAVIDNQINTATATIGYKAVFPNSDDALWPGAVRQCSGSRYHPPQRRHGTSHFRAAWPRRDLCFRDWAGSSRAQAGRYGLLVEP